MVDENPNGRSESLINIKNERSSFERDSSESNDVFINFDVRRGRRSSQNISKDSKVINGNTINEPEIFHQNHSSIMKSSSTSNLFSNDNEFKTSTVTQVIHVEPNDEKLNGKFSQQLKKDGYLLPIGYEDNCQVWSSSSAFPFPVPHDNAFVKSRTDVSPNESFEDSSASSFSAPKNHSYVNSINDNDMTSEVRFDLLKELMQKESEYTFLMKILHDDYYLTIKKMVDSGFLKTNDFLQIFDVPNQVYEFNAKIFQELELKQTKWNTSTSNQTICDVIYNNCREVKVFEEFLEKSCELFKCLDNLYQSPSTKRFVDDLNDKVEKKYGSVIKQMKIERSVKEISLKTFLQYILLWPDLFNKFLITYGNHLTFEHEDFKYFEEIINYFNDLATKCFHINEEWKNIEILNGLQKRIGNKYSILSKNRFLLKEGPLVVLSPHLGTITHIYVILLSDLLIICDQANNEHEQLQPKSPLSLKGISVSANVDAFNISNSKFPLKKTRSKSASRTRENSIKPENGISIDVPCIRRVFRFYARNHQEKMAWFNMFYKVAQVNKEETNIDRTNIGKQKPTFVDAKLCHYCFKCKSGFSTFNRKHYCRACGYIFCRECSEASLSLEYDHNKKNRVCDLCYDFMKNTFRTKPPSNTQLSQRIGRV